MFNLGHKYPTPGNCEVEKAEPESHIDYPTVYLRASKEQGLPDLPKGEFFFIAKGRVAGMRDPSDGEKSIDLEVLSMTPAIAESEIKELIAETYESDEDEEEGEEKFSGEKALAAFHESLRAAVSDTQIGQAPG